jgi:hypothetical protein
MPQIINGVLLAVELRPQRRPAYWPKNDVEIIDADLELSPGRY